MYIFFLDAGIGFICGSATCPKITSNTFHCILMSIGLFIEDARGLVNQNIFREVQLHVGNEEGCVPKAMNGMIFGKIAVR
jgi:hypothetical protein